MCSESDRSEKKYFLSNHFKKCMVDIITTHFLGRLYKQLVQIAYPFH